MRLSAFERQTLKQAALSSFGPGVVLRLFGSRVADGQRGGDIDLLVETQLLDPAQIAQAHTRFLARVYSHLVSRCSRCADGTGQSLQCGVVPGHW